MKCRTSILACLISCLFVLGHQSVGLAQEAKRAKRILLIGQASDGHPKGTHEYRAGMGVLAKMLSRVKNVQTIVVSADGDWAEGPELLDAADAVVLFVSEGAKWIHDDAKRLKAFNALAKRGGGFSCVHWGMGTKDAKNIAAFVALFGGCHGGPDRRYKVVEVEMKLGKHPVLTNVQPITLKEEFYFKLKQPKDIKGFTPLVRVNIEEADHTVSWAWKRPDGGRSFGFTGLHFHQNWNRETYRRLMTQGVLWTAGVAIPKSGVDVKIDKSDLLLPESTATLK
jgi:type 1 glutamine amidotransferase